MSYEPTDQPKTISIIGGRGKMGSLFARSFREQGYRVLVSDENNSNNIPLAQQGEVVIVSVPIERTVEVVKEIGPQVRTDSLLTDFTSVKAKPVAAMLTYSRAEVIGGHPLFGPSIEKFHNQNMILCPARGKDSLSWYSTALEKLGLKVTFMDPKEHDQTMAMVQCLTHFSNIVFASAISAMDYQYDQQDATTPAYLLRLYAAARMLTQDPSLYAGILIENPFAREAINAYSNAVKEISTLVHESKKEGLESLLNALQERFRDHPVLEKKKAEIIDE